MTVSTIFLQPLRRPSTMQACNNNTYFSSHMLATRALVGCSHRVHRVKFLDPKTQRVGKGRAFQFLNAWKKNCNSGVWCTGILNLKPQKIAYA